MKRLVQEAAKAFAVADEAGVLGEGIIEIPRALFDVLKALAHETKDPYTGRQSSVQGYVERLIRGHIRSRGIAPPAHVTPGKTQGKRGLTGVPKPGTIKEGGSRPVTPTLSPIETFKKREPTMTIETTTTTQNASLIDNLPQSGAPETLDSEDGGSETVTQAKPETTTAPVRHLTIATLPTTIARPTLPTTVAEALAAANEARLAGSKPKCGGCLFLNDALPGTKTACSRLHKVEDSGVTVPITEKSEPCDKFTKLDMWEVHTLRLLKAGTREQLVGVKRWLTPLLKVLETEQAEKLEVEADDVIRYRKVEADGSVNMYRGVVTHAPNGSMTIQVSSAIEGSGNDPRIDRIHRTTPIEVVERRSTLALGEKRRTAKSATTPEAIEKAQNLARATQMRVVKAIGKLEDRDTDTGPVLSEILEAMGCPETDTDRIARITAAIDVLRAHKVVRRVKSEEKIKKIKNGKRYVKTISKTVYVLTPRMGVHAAQRIASFPQESKLTLWGKLMTRAAEKAGLNAEKGSE